MSAVLSFKTILEELVFENFKVEKVSNLQNCEALDRKIIAKVRVKTLQEILRLLNIAKTYSTPLYPISKGCNWGFGGAVPTSDGCILLDLSEMNQISEFDSEFGTVNIQPGVTQKQLCQFLEKSTSLFRMDVTGSGEETSVLGNALERGVGYQALRHESLVSLKVLLSDGSVLDTGYSRFSNSDLGKCLSFGLGASVNHLFTQSNFGIILEATIQLLKKPEYHCVISYSLENQEELFENAELVKELFDEEVIHCIPKLADKRRCEIVFCSKFFERALKNGTSVTRLEAKAHFEKLWGQRMWTMIASVSGPRKIVETKLEHIRHKLKNIKLRVIDDEMLSRPITNESTTELQRDFDQVVYGYTSGVPSNDSLRSAYWDVVDYVENPQKPENQDYGILYFAPLIPNSKKHLESFLDIYQKKCKEFDCCPAMTLNFLNRNSIEAVLSLSFLKEDKFEVLKARQLRNVLFDAWSEVGILPYRLSSDSMERVLCQSDYDWNLFQKKLKNSLDPDNLISPQRYSI